tara:strand:- start:53 stop:934 length:882 start_codon:yes stop_codon:yes gene_type:complete
MKKYAYGLNNYRDENVINDENAINYIKNRENNLFKTYDKYVDLFPSNEVSLSDEIFDFSISIGVNNPSNLKNYFKKYQEQDLKLFFDSDFSYYSADFSKQVLPNFFYQTKFKITGKIPKIIGAFSFLKFSSGVDKDMFDSYMNSLVDIYSSIIGPFKSVHIEEPAISCTQLDLFEIDMISSFYEKLSQKVNTKINIFSSGDLESWWILDLKVNGVGLNFINNPNNFKNFNFDTDKTIFAGFINENKLNDTQINQIKKLEKNIKDLYICNVKPLSYYKNHEKVLENFSELERVI